MPQQIDTKRVLLSTAEAGVISGFTQEYISWLLRGNRIEGFKAGHDWLVFEDSLRTFLAQPRKPGPKPKAASDSSMPETTEKQG